MAVIEGKAAFSRLKFESGVHRVQRVPATEASGRIHTSAVTVAVLPEAEEVEVQFDPKDLRVDTFCSSGPGGQSVNTTYSAVRITHLPSGLVVSCQDEKSRSRTRRRRSGCSARASSTSPASRSRRASPKPGAARWDAATAARRSAPTTSRENRITDHRIALTLHSLPTVLGGELDALIEPLQAREQAERLRALSL